MFVFWKLFLNFSKVDSLKYFQYSDMTSCCPCIWWVWYVLCILVKLSLLFAQSESAGYKAHGIVNTGVVTTLSQLLIVTYPAFLSSLSFISYFSFIILFIFILILHIILYDIFELCWQYWPCVGVCYTFVYSRRPHVWYNYVTSKISRGSDVVTFRSDGLDIWGLYVEIPRLNRHPSSQRCILRLIQTRSCMITMMWNVTQTTGSKPLLEVNVVLLYKTSQSDCFPGYSNGPPRRGE